MIELIKSWTFLSRSGNEISITLDRNGIAVGPDQKSISFKDLFTLYNPLADLAGKDQLEIYHFVTGYISEVDPLSYRSFSEFQFWLAQSKLNLIEKVFKYESKVTNTSYWEIKLSNSGIQYVDESGCYHHPGVIIEQSLADFWFYGPLYPIPDSKLRIEIIQFLKASLLMSGFLYPDSHFKIIMYPEFISPPEWVDGDYKVSTFVILRTYGLDHGLQNFHDGLVFHCFVSFEHCMNRSDLAGHILTTDIIEQVHDLIKDANLNLLN